MVKDKKSEDEETVERKPKGKLPRKLTFQIGDYLKSIKDHIPKMASSEIASAIKERFSVDLTNQTVRELLKDLTLPKPKDPRLGPKAVSKGREVIALAKAVKQLYLAVDKILHDLTSTQGITLPEDVAAIIRRAVEVDGEAEEGEEEYDEHEAEE